MSSGEYHDHLSPDNSISTCGFPGHTDFFTLPSVPFPSRIQNRSASSFCSKSKPVAPGTCLGQLVKCKPPASGRRRCAPKSSHSLNQNTGSTELGTEVEIQRICTTNRYHHLKTGNVQPFFLAAAIESESPLPAHALPLSAFAALPPSPPPSPLFARDSDKGSVPSDPSSPP